MQRPVGSLFFMAQKNFFSRARTTPVTGEQNASRGDFLCAFRRFLSGYPRQTAGQFRRRQTVSVMSRIGTWFSDSVEGLIRLGQALRPEERTNPEQPEEVVERSHSRRMDGLPRMRAYSPRHLVTKTEPQPFRIGRALGHVFRQMNPRRKRVHSWVFGAVSMMVLLSFAVGTFFPRGASGATYVWTQTQWDTLSANTTGSPAPSNWTQYVDKTTQLNTGTSLKINNQTASVTQTTDVDFSTGTNQNTPRSPCRLSEVRPRFALGAISSVVSRLRGRSFAGASTMPDSWVMVRRHRGSSRYRHWESVARASSRISSNWSWGVVTRAD